MKIIVHADGRPVLRHHRQQLRRHPELRRLRQRRWRARRRGASACTSARARRRRCRRPAPGATKTTISGTVYDPAGVNPLYNVIVYIPSGPLPTLADGVTCDRCGAQVVAPLGVGADRHAGALHADARAGAVDDQRPARHAGRQVAAADHDPERPRPAPNNAITDKDQTRLPRTKAEGNIPRIAVTTGGSDALECLLRRIGIADTEFTDDGGTGARPPLRRRRRHEQLHGGRHASRPRRRCGRTATQARDLRHHRAVVRGQHERVRRR